MGKPQSVTRPKTIGDAMDTLHKFGYRPDSTQGQKTNKVTYSKGNHKVVLPCSNRRSPMRQTEAKAIQEMFQR